MSGSWEWECSECTFLNSHIEHRSACQMCLIERRRPWNNSRKWGGAEEKREESHNDDDFVVDSTSDHSLSNNCVLEFSQSLRKELGTETSKNSDDASAEQCEINQAMSGRWDAFASLQANYESSSDEEKDDDDSSDDEESDNEESECCDDDFVDDGDTAGEKFKKRDYHDRTCHNDKGLNHKIPSQTTTTTTTTTTKSVECINLVDSDDEDEIIDTSGKENKKNALHKSILKKRPKKYRIESDSDCSISEEESHRPMPSPSARGAPSWRPPRRRSSTLIQTSNQGNIKSSDEFPCMSTRNDVIGNSSSPCIVQSTRPRLSDGSKEEEWRQPSSKKSSTLTKTSSIVSASRKRSRITSEAAASKGGSKAPARKRRRGGVGGGGKYKKRSSYKRSSAKRGRTNRAETSNNNSNSAWSERERGIRQPRRGGGGGSSTGPYMAIAKQEPVLRNVGGASIQF